MHNEPFTYQSAHYGSILTSYLEKTLFIEKNNQLNLILENKVTTKKKLHVKKSLRFYNYNNFFINIE